MNGPTVIKRGFLLVLLVGLSLTGLRPAGSRRPTYTLQPESRMWLEGTSSLNAFTCEDDAVVGHGTLGTPDSTEANDALDAHARVLVRIPIRRFDCGNMHMEDDLYAAMKAAAHPFIRFTMTDARILAAPKDTSGWYLLRATGRLALAGTQRRIAVDVKGRELPNGRLEAEGEKKLLMSDFGIKPPTALFGLIRARDQITVHFHLVAARNTANP